MYFSDAMAYNQQAAQAQYVLAAQMQQAGQVVQQQQQQAAQQVRAPQVMNIYFLYYLLETKSLDLGLIVSPEHEKMRH